MFKLTWIFAGLITILATFTGCTEYIFNCVSYSENGESANFAAHKTWCGDCKFIVGNVKSGENDFCGANCVYPSSDGCGGTTYESCFMGYAGGTESGANYHAVVLGDTGSDSAIAAGLVNGCLCVTCDDEAAEFGYYLPFAYELASYAQDAQSLQETTEAISGCLGS